MPASSKLISVAIVDGYFRHSLLLSDAFAGPCQCDGQRSLAPPFEDARHAVHFSRAHIECPYVETVMPPDHDGGSCWLGPGYFSRRQPGPPRPSGSPTVNGSPTCPRMRRVTASPRKSLPKPSRWSGVEVDYGFFPWARAMKLAQDGSWDGSAIWGESEGAPRRTFYFSDAIIRSVWVFFPSRKTNLSTWNGYGGLGKYQGRRNRRVSLWRCIRVGRSGGPVFRTIRGRSDEVGLANLLKGRIDVFPGELMVTRAQIADNFTKEEARPLPPTTPRRSTRNPYISCSVGRFPETRKCETASIRAWRS